MLLPATRLLATATTAVPLVMNRSLSSAQSSAQRATSVLQSPKNTHTGAEKVHLQWDAAGGRAKDEPPAPVRLQHFKVSENTHPLNIQKSAGSTGSPAECDVASLPDGDPIWKNPTQNHIWSTDELSEALSTQPRHKPVGLLDWVLRSCVRTCYHSFNFMTGYNKENPTPKSCEYRLVILESIAGVPGMVGGSIRHFRSLRTMHRDHGWIHTLLEEAENERMHLLICLQMFQPSSLVRGVVIAAQMALLPIMTAMYIVKPKALHRFVGYLEETAVETYSGIIEQMDKDGSLLHGQWKDLDAPLIAKQYYRLNDDAKWPEVVKCIAADETNHRDVNHTFAGMTTDDPNPYVVKHNIDASKAWRVDTDAIWNEGR